MFQTARIAPSCAVVQWEGVQTARIAPSCAVVQWEGVQTARIAPSCAVVQREGVQARGQVQCRALSDEHFLGRKVRRALDPRN